MSVLIVRPQEWIHPNHQKQDNELPFTKALVHSDNDVALVNQACASEAAVRPSSLTTSLRLIHEYPTDPHRLCSYA